MGAPPATAEVGFGFMAHGVAKLSKGPDAFAAILSAMSVPLPHLMAWVTISLELLGGLAFLLGAYVAVASVPMTVLLAVATSRYICHTDLLDQVDGFRRAGAVGPPGYECDLLYIACMVALALSGPGPLSLTPRKDVC